MKKFPFFYAEFPGLNDTIDINYTVFPYFAIGGI
jgi:hypothetical protein